jgi:tetratricopeptide (TPR) repeat protein
MKSVPSAPAPVPAAAADLRGLLERFEAAWQGETPPTLEAFLPTVLVAGSVDPVHARRALLEGLVKIDLEHRWRQAQEAKYPSRPSATARSAEPTSETLTFILPSRPCLEDYVAHHPELGCLEQLSPELIAAEYRVRQRWGDQPQADAYAKRFPHHAGRLRDLLPQVDAELAADKTEDGSGKRAPTLATSVPQQPALTVDLQVPSKPYDITATWPPSQRVLPGAAADRRDAGEPVVTRPVSRWERLRQWVRRRPALTALAALGSVTVLGLVLGILWLNVRLEAEMRRAEANEAESRRQEAEARAQQERAEASMADARKQQQLAEENYQLARDAVEHYLTRVADHPRLQVGGLRSVRRELLEEASRFYDRFIQKREGDPKLERELAQAYSKSAFLAQEMGLNPEARKRYQQACGLWEELVAAHPDSADLQTSLAHTYRTLGVLQSTTGERAAAVKSLEQARQLWVKLVAAHPEVPSYVDDLARTYNTLGLLQQNSGERAAALQSYEQATSLQEKLVAAHPEVPGYQDGLAGSYNSLSLVQYQTGTRTAALHSLQQALRLREKLAAAHPEVPNYQKALGQNYTSLGSLQSNTGERAAALQSHMQAQRVREQLMAAHPDVPGYQDDLAATYNNLGLLQLATGERTAALQSHEQARGLLEKLVAAYPDLLDYQINLGGTYTHLGTFHRDSGRPEEAFSWYAKAISGLEAVRQRQPKHPTARNSLRNAFRARADMLTRLGRHSEALPDWDRALELEAGPDRARFRLWRALTLAQIGEHVQATAEVNDLSRSKSATGATLYDAACVFALSSAAVGKDAKLPQTERAQLVEQYMVRAVQLLIQAQAAGLFKDPRQTEHLKKDTDLDSLRLRADYQKLLSELEKVAPPGAK